MDKAQITIRRLQAADAQLYREIRLEALEREPEAYSSTFGAEYVHRLDWFADRIARSPVFGAFAERKLLGIAGFFAQAGAKHAHKGAVWGVYVRPEARGQGVGRQLVETVIGFARDHVEILQITVVTGNEAALRLYEALGFVQYGLEKKALKHDGVYSDEILMALELEELRNSELP